MSTAAVALPGLETGADAYMLVRSLLVRGSIPPGARVTESALAARLGVSRTPVRETMRRLLAEGLLMVDGGGARPRMAAAPISAADVTEVYEAAGALEGVMARRIATLAAKDRRALITKLEACERGFRRATRQRPLSYPALFEQHDLFHITLRDACAGPAARALLDALQPRLSRYEWLYAPLVGPDFSATFAEHAAITRAVHTGGAAATERAVRANWFNSATRLVRALQHTGEIENSVAVRTAARQ